MALGPLFVDLPGPDLDAADRELLGAPAVGGVVLFSRNYESPRQLAALVARIHGLREPRLLVAVDQEGGRVQRLRRGFTRLPAAARLGRLHDREPATAARLAEALGWVIGAELRACGVDVDFAPVLDLARDDGRGAVGDRALHEDPAVVARLAHRLVRGLRAGGVSAVGKHFPGHGSVAADSHLELPVDPRELETIRYADLVPFARLIGSGLAAVMTAHVRFPAVDAPPATFSRVWLRDVLRGELGFSGAVLSDDLGMHGAVGGGASVPERVEAALAAGCDVALVCNDRGAAEAAADAIGARPDPVRSARLAPLHGRGSPDPEALRADPRHREVAGWLAALDDEPELDLGDDGL